MKVIINMELDCVLDKDILFFLSNEKLVTKCIKTMSIKKDKTDKVTENGFDIIMNKGLTSMDEDDISNMVNTSTNRNASSNTDADNSYIE